MLAEIKQAKSFQCELQVVQSSLVGSILSNILLVLGMCFFAGGVRFAEQAIKSTAAQLNASLLLIAVIAVLIPSAFHFSISSSTSNTDASELANGEGADLLSMSHAVSILLLILYLGYLLFQMWTHAVGCSLVSIFASSSAKSPFLDLLCRRRRNRLNSISGSNHQRL